MGARSLAAFERFMRALDGGPPFAARARPMAGDWRRVREGFARLAQQYAAGRPYRFGARLTYADLVVAAILATVRNCVSAEQFEDVRAWDGGRWGALVDEVEGAGYLATDRGEVYDAHT
jgi:glutathione S-transferase